MFSRMLRELYYQIDQLEATELVEVIPDDRTEISVGNKRQNLYAIASGKYICSIDDDDTIYPYYLNEILNAIKSDPDAVGTNGIITWDGRKEQKWFISKDNPYDAQTRFDNTTVYARFHNHLSPIRATIAKQFKFPDKSMQEDYDWALQVHNSGLIQTEVCIGTTLSEWMNNPHLKTTQLPIYHYRYVARKTV